MSTIGGYRVEEELGRGAMGVVYAATGASGRVAIKVMTEAGALDPEALARFVVEARALARLDHPNIVRFVEAGAAGRIPFVALEHIDGETLAARLSRGPIPPREAARLLAALASAVHHAHQRSILHRDLKPANVILRPDGAPTLVDFGLAKVLESGYGPRLSRTGDVLGTPLYMAPEQALGNPTEVGPWTDVYGLGAVFYACLTGGPPIAAGARGLIATLEAVVNQQPAAPSRVVPGIDPALEAICLRCLAKAPADRYPSAASLAAALEEHLATSRPPRRRRGARRPMRGALALGLGALLILLVVVAMALVTGPPPQRAAADPSVELPRPAPISTSAGPSLTSTAGETDPAAQAAELLALAATLLELGQPEQAARKAEQVIALMPGDAEAWALVGKLRGDLGDPVGGLAACDQAVSLDPRSVAARINRGALRFRGRDLRGAEEDFVLALEVDVIKANDRAHAAYNLAVVRHSRGAFAEALAGLNDLISSHPGADEHLLRGQTLEVLGDLEAAAADYARSLELAPDLTPAEGQVALHLAELRLEHLLDDAGARRAVELALELRPKDANAWLLSARAGGPGAGAAAARAVSLAPGLAGALAAQARALLEADDLAAASRAAAEATDGSSPPAAALVARASVRHATGDPGGARDDLERADGQRAPRRGGPADHELAGGQRRRAREGSGEPLVGPSVAREHEEQEPGDRARRGRHGGHLSQARGRTALPTRAGVGLALGSPVRQSWASPGLSRDRDTHNGQGGLDFAAGALPDR